MHNKYIWAAAAAALAYWYFSSKTSAQAQTIPGAAQLYNLGYNYGSTSTFSVSSPVATTAAS